MRGLTLAVVWNLAIGLQAADWPAWRYDTARSAEWPGTLSEELHLQWVRELPAPMRAWRPQRDDGRKLEFDVAFTPVAAAGLLFVPSSSTDSVTAYRVSDGTEVWRFFTDGPVRLAPAYAEGRLFFTSDDGHLYCLNASDGRLIWKFRAGPSDHRLLGNERIINVWAARGAALVKDGIVYFAAGLWPLHGVFIYALNTTDGSVVWVNDTMGSDYVRVPRGSVYGGMAPQGYLAVSQSFPEAARDRRGRPLDGDYLFVSGGRGGPVFLCRTTGVVAADLFNVTSLLRRKQAGGFAIHGVNGGGIEKLENPMLRERANALADQLDGSVFYKLAVDDRMVIVTESGTLYCFGPQSVDPVRHTFRPTPVAPGAPPWPDVARDLLARHGDDGGYALVLGAGSGGLSRELLLQSRMHVVIVEADPDRGRTVREGLAGTGKYGRRVAVIVADPAGFSVQPYLFSIIAAEDAGAAGLGADADALARILDRLRPYNGVGYFGKTRIPAAILEQALATAAVDQVTVRDMDGSMLAERSGPLPGAGQWTHQYHDAANTLLSEDDRARLPLGVLWFGGPNNHNVLGKHSRGPRPQIAAGRQLFMGVNTLGARCVYTGRELWEHDFPGIGDLFDTTANLPGVTYIGSPYVTLADSVYVRYRDAIHRLDPATGDSLAVFPLPERRLRDIGEDAFDWGHISVQGDVLVTTRDLLMVDDQRPARPSSYSATASSRLVVMNRHSGDILWEREARQGFRHNAIVSSGNRIFIVDGLPESQLALLARRGSETEIPTRLYALKLADGKEIWHTGDRVLGTFLLYCSERDLLIEGGSHDLRHSGARPDQEPTQTIARRGADGAIVWENSSFRLPAAVRDDMLISASRFQRRAISMETGGTWQRTDPHTGEQSAWTFTKSKNCDSLNASRHLLLFRTTNAGFFDLRHDSGTGFFSGFRSGCTANMIAADGVVNAIDYTRRCNCSYPHQTSLALIHMPDDSNIEFWMTGSGTDPDPEGHGINFGAPGRRIDVAGSQRIWFPRNGSRTRHPSAILDCGPSIPWVLASLLQIEDGETIRVDAVKPGPYLARFHFADLETTQPGQRVFDIAVNGTDMATGIDIVALAGGPLRGIVKEFPVHVDERLTFQLRPANGSSLPPVINGLELIAQD